jgi:MFS family permease
MAPPATAELSTARKWAITVSVMLVTVMQIVDTSVTNVALPHMQGDRGEREDWFESGWIVGLSVIAVCALAGFIARELLTDHPVLDFSVFSDRNFTLGAALVSLSAFGLYASMLLIAL